MTAPVNNNGRPGQIDMTAVAVLQRYFDIRDKNTNRSAGALYDPLMALVTRGNGVVARAQSLQSVLGTPSWTKHEPNARLLPGGVFGVPLNNTYGNSANGGAYAEGTYWTRNPVQATPYMLQALQVAQDLRDDLATHENDYQAVIDLALKNCGPEKGAMLSDDMVSACKSDILTSLAGQSGMLRNQAAQRILNQAIADNNNTVLYTMLSGPMDTVWLGFGDVSVKTLQSVYAEAIAKQSAQDGTKMAPAIAFVALQDGDYALKNLVPAALDAFDYHMQQVRALIRR